MSTPRAGRVPDRRRDADRCRQAAEQVGLGDDADALRAGQSPGRGAPRSTRHQHRATSRVRRDRHAVGHQLGELGSSSGASGGRQAGRCCRQSVGGASSPSRPWLPPDGDRVAEVVTDGLWITRAGGVRTARCGRGSPVCSNRAASGGSSGAPAGDGSGGGVGGCLERAASAGGAE